MTEDDRKQPEVLRFVLTDQDGQEEHVVPWSFVKVTEGGEDQLARVPALPNDDQPAGARENAAADGRVAGRRKVPSAEIAEEDGLIAQRYIQRGLGGASRARARGEDQVAALEAAAGPAVARSLAFQSEAQGLEEEQRRWNAEARRHRKLAGKLRRRRLGLRPLRRGLIQPPVETIVTVTLGAADIMTLGLFLTQRAAVTAAQAWFAAVLAGLGAAVAGWAIGRAAAGGVGDVERLERRSLLAAILVVFGCAVWFVLAMHSMRDADVTLGVAVSIKFGAPLAALTIFGASLVSFVAGAGTEGLELERLAAEADGRAQSADAQARDYAEQRRQLGNERAAARGAFRAARSQITAVRQAAAYAAEAAIAEGRELWGIYGEAARSHQPEEPEDMEQINRRLLHALRERDDAQMADARSRTRKIAVLLAATGAGVAAIAGQLLGFPLGVIALAAMALASLAVTQTPAMPDRPEEVDELLRRIAALHAEDDDSPDATARQKHAPPDPTPNGADPAPSESGKT